MKKRRLEGGAPWKMILTALFVMLCAAAFAQKTESWAPVQSAADFKGRWEGSTEVELPLDGELGLIHPVIPVSITLDYVQGRGDLTVVIKVDVNRLLDDVIALPEIQELYEGITKDVLWDMLVESWFSAMDGDIEFGGGYTVQYTMSGPAEDLVGDDSITINRNKSRLRLLLDGSASMGFGYGIPLEMILDKK